LLGRLSLAAVALLSISSVASAGTVLHILDTTRSDRGTGKGHGIDFLSKDFAGTLGSWSDSSGGGTPFSGGHEIAAYLVSEFGSDGGDKGGDDVKDAIWGVLGGGKGGDPDGSWLDKYKHWGDSGGGGCRVTSVPEPRYMAVMLIGLLLIGSVAYRKLQAQRRVGVYANPQA